jgi:hypothetical protein
MIMKGKYQLYQEKERKEKKRKGRGQHNYHKLLEPIMKSVAEIEAIRRNQFYAKIGNQVKKVRLHVIVYLLMMVKVVICCVVLVLVVIPQCWMH